MTKDSSNLPEHLPGDSARSWNALFVDHQTDLKRYLQKCIEHSPIQQIVSPSDIVQLTYLRMVSSLERRKKTPEKQRFSCLRLIAVRILVDEYRKWKAQRQRERHGQTPVRTLARLVESTSSIWRKVFRIEATQELKAALAEISPRDHKLVYLRVFRELEWQEIGQQLGCSADAARVRYKDSILPNLAQRLAFLNPSK